MKRFRELRSLRLSDICSPSKALQRYHREQRQDARELEYFFPDIGRQPTLSSALAVANTRDIHRARCWTTGVIYKI